MKSNNYHYISITSGLCLFTFKERGIHTKSGTSVVEKRGKVHINEVDLSVLSVIVLDTFT